MFSMLAVSFVMTIETRLACQKVTSVLVLNCTYKMQSLFAMFIEFVLTVFFVLYISFWKNDRIVRFNQTSIISLAINQTIFKF